MQLTNPVAVGDEVEFETVAEDKGQIKKILPRENYVVRQSPRRKHALHLLASNIDQAIQLANDTRYGLSAAVFTQDLDAAMKFARRVESGNIQINWGPQWRADLMPYGGLKESGMGKEGPKYAIDEMTEQKTVIIHG